ncbi:MAG: hypothetical protein CVU77_07565 [Elusimicrobia bacterium HGW-Elusimicrobia-1]|nr:MAG: hypothetical protein CVU77_07565 [Elusimicrobia bacterium HGW-Elusimicrobia-1]
MRKGTLEKFLNLELVLESQGYKARITSTTTGNHQNPAHKEGDAVDFKVYKGGKEISPSDSFHIEEVCKKMGWAVY